METNSTLKLSIIIPVYNEGERLFSFIQHVLRIIGPFSQIIIVDGASNDHSLQSLKALSLQELNLELVSAPKSRALQMNAGAKIAKGNTLLFLHADTLLPETAIAELNSFWGSNCLWGRFDVKLDHKALAYKIIAWFINKRSRLTGIATGDQAIFVKRALFEKIKGYKDQPLMEDIELCMQLKKHSKPYFISSTVCTSARKWENEGVVKTVWLMWKLRAAYAMGKSPQELVKIYYKQS